MSSNRQSSPTGKTTAEWRAIEQAAIEELRRRTTEAHATVVGLLQRHGKDFSAKQMSQIRRRLGRS